MDLVKENLIEILGCTSTDRDHPISSILDGKDETFWMTTGTYPQEFLLHIKENKIVTISKVRIVSSNVRNLCIEATSKTQPISLDKLVDTEILKRDSALQVESFNIPTDKKESKCRYLRFKILSGWDEYCSVHSIQLFGQPVDDSVDAG